MNGFIVFADSQEMVDILTDQQKSVLLDAILAYSAGADLPEMDPTTKAVFISMRQTADRVSARSNSISEQRSAAGQAGAAARWHKEDASAITDMANDGKNGKAMANDGNDSLPNRNQTDTKEKDPKGSKEKGTRFVAPTVDQVREYCTQNGYRVDAERFVDFYASKGWLVGKSPMKDWRAAARNWSKDKKEQSPPNMPVFNFEQRQYDWGA